MGDDQADDEIVTCWCGEQGTAEELFSDDPFLDNCGGTGFLYCHCGGDLCVCHHHGQEIECPGCEDCNGGDDDPRDFDDIDFGDD